MAKVTNIKPISYFKANATEMLMVLRETRVPYVITQNGEAAAVLVEPHAYEEMLESIELLRKIQRGEEDLRNGHTLSLDQVKDRIMLERKRRSKERA